MMENSKGRNRHTGRKPLVLEKLESIGFRSWQVVENKRQLMRGTSIRVYRSNSEDRRWIACREISAS